MNAVLGVIGGSGGAGASTFAAALAAAAGEAVLVDLDVASGGLDVALGIEAVPGARWSGLHLAGGRLDPRTLLAGLPRWGACAVLAADVPAVDPDAVLQVLSSASAACPVVLDLPRLAGAERAAGLLHCDLVVIVARADVRGLVAAHAVASALPELPVGVVVRRGEVAARAAADLVGVPLLGEVPNVGGRLRLDSGRVPRPLARVASGVLAGVRAAPAGRHAA